MGNDSFEEIMARVDELDAALDSLGEDLEEAKKKKKPYDSITVTTGNIGYNLDQFNKHMGTAFPGNDNNNPSTEEAKAQAAAEKAAQDAAEASDAAPAGDAGIGDGGMAGGEAGDGGEGVGLGEELQRATTPDDLFTLYRDNWLDCEVDYDDLYGVFERGLNGDAFPVDDVLETYGWSSSYDYCESMYDLGKDIHDNGLQAAINDAMSRLDPNDVDDQPLIEGSGEASGSKGEGMGESLEEDLNLMEGAILNEDRILIPKLVKNGVAEAKAYIELPAGVSVLPREQVSEALTKLSPAEEFVIGYITPVYFYKELWDLFNVVKCTEFIGYTGMDYRQVRDETRTEYDTDRDSRLNTAKNQIENPNDSDNQYVKRIDQQSPKAYGQINKTVVQKQIDKVDYDSILYYPAPGKKPKVCYYIDMHDGHGYSKISRAQFEKYVINYVETAMQNGTLIGSNRWNIAALKKKIIDTLAVDNATTGKDALDAQKLWEPTATNVADNKVFKPQVRALYTNQVYYLSTPYETLGTPLNPSLLEDIELDEAKRETRRYYIRPQGIFCANKAEVIRGLISIGNENCCVYSLKGLGDNRDVHKLTNKDIIYYYDDGILYDKNHVKVMDYDLYIKHEEERKKFPGDVDNVSGAAFADEYDDRITDITGPGIEESIGKSILEFWDLFDEKPANQASFAEDLVEDNTFDQFNEELHEDAEVHTCCICGDEFVGYGNNPEPVKNFDDGVCCDACNLKFVIPARLAKFNKDIK